MNDSVRPTGPQRPERRDLLQSAAALALVAGAPAASADEPPPPAGPQPGAAMRSPAMRTRRPGQPGDFAFLDGHWRIRHQKRRADGSWDVFDGEASCFGILGGICSVEELRIPARNFSGMGLRLLDIEQRVWVDHWVNAATGVVVLPGMSGAFEEGAGIFEAEDEENGRRLLHRGVWDRITGHSCRWQQGRSDDGGRSWSLSWSMDWTRVR